MTSIKSSSSSKRKEDTKKNENPRWNPYVKKNYLDAGMFKPSHTPYLGTSNLGALIHKDEPTDPLWNRFGKINTLDQFRLRSSPSGEKYCAGKQVNAIAHADTKDLKKPLWNPCGKRDCLGDRLFTRPKEVDHTADERKLVTTSMKQFAFQYAFYVLEKDNGQDFTVLISEMHAHDGVVYQMDWETIC